LTRDEWNSCTLYDFGLYYSSHKKSEPVKVRFFLAGDGNRTHVTSLEGWSSTTELHPRFKHQLIFIWGLRITSGAPFSALLVLHFKIMFLTKNILTRMCQG
jgi:hypothetical protein